MYLFRNEDRSVSELQSSSGSFGVFDSLYMAHCDRNGTMVRTVISPKLYAIFLQGFQFPDKEVSTESMTHAVNRRKLAVSTTHDTT